ncbi:MAG: hypothetical protein AAFV69_10635 [Pseudomonadota bacterium]
MKLKTTEIIYTGITGAAIGIAYQIYSAWSTKTLHALSTLDIAAAACIGAAAALLALTVRTWINDAKDQ